MDPDKEIDVDMSPFIIIYKSGRVERLIGTETVPPSVDPATGVVSKDVTIDAGKGISARLFLPQVIISPADKKMLPILVYYHGGAFCTSSPFAPGYTSYLNSLVSKAKIIAVSVDYCLAPENLLPAAYDDSEVALNWVLSSQDAWLALYGDLGRVFMAGDSAGANITHQMAIRREGQQKIEGIVLFDAHFWGSEPIECETTDPEVRGWYKKMWTTINLPGVHEDHPTQNPLVEGAPSLAGLGCRRAMVCVAGEDVLAARGRAYYHGLRGSGWRGESEMKETEGEGHVFHLNKPDSPEAKALMDRVVAFINAPNLVGN